MRAELRTEPQNNDEYFGPTRQPEPIAMVTACGSEFGSGFGSKDDPVETRLKSVWTRIKVQSIFYVHKLNK